jgi:hypothetical protein
VERVAVGGTVASIAPGSLRLSEGGEKNGDDVRAYARRRNPATDADVGLGGALADGLVSSGAEDFYTLAVSGLVPSATLRCISMVAKRTVLARPCSGRWHRGFVWHGPWRREGAYDFAKMAANADVQGRLSVTFAAAEWTSALWRGFQIAGASSTRYVRRDLHRRPLRNSA